MSTTKTFPLIKIADTVSVVTIIAGSAMFLYGLTIDKQAPLIAFMSLQASLSGQSVAGAAVAVSNELSLAIGLVWWGITVVICGIVLSVLRHKLMH